MKRLLISMMVPVLVFGMALALVPTANADLPCGLVVNKTVDFNGDGIYTKLETNYAGSIASWKVVVTNEGGLTSHNITVTDTNGHDFSPDFDLDPGLNQTFFYNMTIYVNTVNTASAIGWNAGHDVNCTYNSTAEVRIITVVGGEVRPTNKISLLAPWIGLALALIGGTAFFISRRRRA